MECTDAAALVAVLVVSVAALHTHACIALLLFIVNIIMIHHTFLASSHFKLGFVLQS